MKLLFTAIFIFCISGGAGWAYYNQMSVIGYVACLAVSGFLGSCVIALVFIYLYFFQADAESDQQESLAQPDRRIAHADPKETKQIEK